jgi:hypothetical protein
MNLAIKLKQDCGWDQIKPGEVIIRFDLGRVKVAARIGVSSLLG